MIAKITVGTSLYGALAYNGQKVNEGEGRLLAVNRIFDYGSGRVDVARAEQDFKRFMPEQVRTRNKVIHISLNPHPDDHLTDTELEQLAREYLDRLGYGDQPYLVFKHEDISRHHLHIVSVNVDERGRRLNRDFIHRRSKRITSELEKKYGLHPADRRRLRTDNPLRRVDVSQGDVKRQVSNVAKAVMAGYRFQTMGEYRALLSLYNVTVEEARGMVDGREYHGMVYSATDDTGNRTGTPFKASRIGKSVGYEAVQRRMEKSGEAIKNGKLKERTRKIIATAMQTARSRKELEQQLKKQGIDVVFRQNDSGRIYGVTFIDHDSRVVLNGSRLGKEYSANVFNEHFSGETGNIYQSEVEIQQREQSTHQEQLEFTPKSDIVSGVASVLGAFGSLLGGGASGGDEPQDTARQKRKKKKKRTRRID